MSEAKLSDRQIRNLVELILGETAPVDSNAKALCVLLKHLMETDDKERRTHIFDVAGEYAFRRTNAYGNQLLSFFEIKTADLEL